MKLRELTVCVLSVGLAYACHQDAHASLRIEPDAREADAAMVSDATRDAFSLPLPVLTREQRTRFFLGNSFFNQNWVSAPASTAERDGLGPLFNARSCSTCHFKDGRGRAPDAGADMQTMLLRVSIPGLTEHGAPKPHPIYGDQIQHLSVQGLDAEARVVVDYDEHVETLPDGEVYVLRAPRIQLVDEHYGSASAPLLISARIAPALVGMGLLEAVPEREVLAHADADDRNHDGVSGRANRVWDVVSQTSRLGRFGWKAEQPDLQQQTAGAFLGDMGITSALFPEENCTPSQTVCASLPSGGAPEIAADTLESVVRYVRTLAVPAPRALAPELAAHGAELFEHARCGLCHLTTLHTESVPHVPELTSVAFHAYTDLLLHDLGPGLADARPSFAADGREFRTAPLWGLGLVEKVNGQLSLLNDGRARTFGEAVLWHGGEAEPAKQAFIALSRADRSALLAFVAAL
ncbi:MAG: hypothetical protein RL701_1938 [Pseudomonadota bacterium]